MKRSLSILFCFAVTFGADADILRLSEPVTQSAQSETFGIKIDYTLPKVSMQNLVTDPSLHMANPFRVEARIAKVCQKKGCFFIAQQDQYVLRVSFRNYGFFIPTDSSGKIVMMAGKLVQKHVSPQQVAHFKDDLKSETDSIKPGVIFEIVADSVKIPRSG
jgi:hypothetical protein